MIEANPSASTTILPTAPVIPTSVTAPTPIPEPGATAQPQVREADGIIKTGIEAAVGETGTATLGGNAVDSEPTVKFQTHVMSGPCGDVPCGSTWGADDENPAS